MLCRLRLLGLLCCSCCRTHSLCCRAPGWRVLEGHHHIGNAGGLQTAAAGAVESKSYATDRGMPLRLHLLPPSRARPLLLAGCSSCCLCVRVLLLWRRRLRRTLGGGRRRRAAIGKFPASRAA